MTIASPSHIDVSITGVTVAHTLLEQAVELPGATAPAKLAPPPAEERAHPGDDFQECG